MTSLLSLLVPLAVAGSPVQVAPSVMANAPEVWFTWKKDAGRLTVDGVGEHVAPDAPVGGWIEADGVRISLETTGAAMAGGLPLTLSGKGAHSVAGELSLSLCEDGGTTCRMVDVAFGGHTDGRRGAQLLGTPLGVVKTPRPSPRPAPHAGDAEAAFARAEANGKRVLLDFSAVWCPPCQVLAAEILHDPEEAEWLAAFEVVELDADDPSSFALKSRYAVGGYPTVIVAEADGTLVDRMVGYPGEAPTREWLGETAGELLTIPEILANLSDPDVISDAAAVGAAKRLLKEREEEAARTLLARAPDSVDKQLVEFELEPTLGRLSFLMEAAPDRADEWIWGAFQLLSDVEPGELTPEREAVLEAVAWELATAKPVMAADYAYVAAGLSEGGQAQAFSAAGAALLSAGLSGDPQKDRGHYGFLAHLLADAGDPEAGLEVLDAAIDSFPEEFTYHYSAAGVLKNLERYDEALAYADAAARYAYGDMSLRAAMLQGSLLEALERVDEARDVLTAALTAAERPGEGVEVRTTVYLRRLETQIAELDGDVAAE